MNLGVSFKFVSEVAKLDKAVTAMHKKALYQAGAFLRKSMRQSIRRTMKSSAENTQPATHGAGKYSLKNIWFEVDMNRQSTPIGYVDNELGRIAKLQENGGTRVFKKFPSYQPGRRGFIPQYMLRSTRSGKPLVVISGGSAIHKKVANANDQMAGWDFFRQNIKDKTLTYKPRPFMSATLMKNRQEALNKWRNAL